jgi:ferredoxin
MTDLPHYSQVWTFRQPRKRLLIWLGWLALVALFVWCWQIMTETTIWMFVTDAPKQAADIGGRMLPPRWAYLPELMQPLWDTINIATLGTIGGVIMAVPVAFLAARNTSPSPTFLRPVALFIIVASRSINSLIWALLLVAIIGPGLLAGIIAIALRSIGFVGKLLYEAIEETDKTQIEAITATGASPAIAAAVLAASHLTGTFEQPLHVRTEPLLCAHSRAGQTGCTNCLDLCPTGAITPDGDHITVDPMICAGCGACSAACPSGAISYDAPPVDFTMLRVQTLARAFLDAGGKAPRLMVHDDTHGAEMIRLSARHGRGLPADVVPMALPALAAFGHAEALAALAAGFASVSLLLGPKSDRDAIETQIALARAIAGDARVQLIDTPDPDAMSDTLYDAQAPASVASPVRPMGTRRQITRQAARALHPDTDVLPLPAGAPYGALVVDPDACTLCLSCVSLCPSGALGDNPDLPQLRFQEDACLQCGLCANICPENAITLAPQLDLTGAALEQRVLHEEEPFACVECGTLFGVKSTIDRITDKLRNHSMFTDDAKLRMIQMCDDCRINAQYHATNNPLAGGERPRPRTTDDYLSKRRDH